MGTAWPDSLLLHREWYLAAGQRAPGQRQIGDFAHLLHDSRASHGLMGAASPPGRRAGCPPALKCRFQHWPAAAVEVRGTIGVPAICLCRWRSSRTSWVGGRCPRWLPQGFRVSARRHAGAVGPLRCRRADAIQADARAGACAGQVPAGIGYLPRALDAQSSAGRGGWTAGRATNRLPRPCRSLPRTYEG